MDAREGDQQQSEEHYRREALGAFAHEVRTPLTAIRMVLELGRREGEGRELVLDEELAAMLQASVDDLQRLTDELQETSRLERGKLRVASDPCDLIEVVTAARAELRPHVELDGDVPALSGRWDAERLARALAGLGQAANRAGDGTGRVELTIDAEPMSLLVELRSGSPGGVPKPIAADAGYAFFHSRQAVLAMGGKLECERAERYLLVRVRLPR